MTNLTRWRPLTEPGVFPRDLSQVFDRFFSRGDWGTEDATIPAFYPAIDVSETEDNVLVVAEVPGMDAKDIDISVQDNVLTIKGEKRSEKEEKDEQRHRVERTYGTFTRSFRLPAAVTTEKVAADYKQGVLYITMPKSDESKRRAVKIKVG